MSYNSDKPEMDQESKDPYKGYKFVPRLPLDTCPDKLRFEVPENNMGLSLKQSALRARFTLPSNYVPGTRDNDVLSKAINKLELIIQDTRLFASFDVAEYSQYSHINCKLNRGLVAQETEMFTTGRYDSYDADSDELDTLKVHHNGLNLIENRQQYAEKIWKNADSIMSINVKDSDDKKPVYYKTLFHQYDVRAPLMHGLANQPRLIPPGVKVNVEINLNKQSYCLMQHSNYQICKTTNADIEDITFPYPEDMQMVESSGTHETFAVCDCKAKLETNEYSRISE
ncbi:unnamed protein product, partial [Oikopleura dioica]